MATRLKKLLLVFGTIVWSALACRPSALVGQNELIA